MENYSLTLDQARNNMEVLHHHHATLITDDEGNLNYIPWYNVPGVIVQWLKNLFSGTEAYRIYEAVLKTFQTLNMHKQANPTTTPWTYYCEDGMGKDYAVGFDKVAMGVLLDRWNFPAHYMNVPQGKNDHILYDVRQEAYVTLLWATRCRTELGLEFDSDYLPSPDVPKRVVYWA